MISPEHVLISLLSRKKVIFQMYSSSFKLLFSVQLIPRNNKINICAHYTIFVIDSCACGFIHVFNMLIIVMDFK